MPEHSERLIVHASRSLSKTERNYSQIEKYSLWSYQVSQVLISMFKIRLEVGRSFIQRRDIITGFPIGNVQ